MNIINTIFLLSSFRMTGATWSEMPSHDQDGKVIIGGMFPLHFNVQREDNYDLLSQPSVPVCRDYNFRGFRWMQAMIFAIEEINNSSTLLPDVKLGWKIYDTCDTMSRAVTQTLAMVDTLQQNSSVSVLVGPTGSDKSIGVANILGVFDLPQISYGSTSRTLSDKDNFNSFLRTIPNDDEQATAIVDLLSFYNWTWVGAIAGDDEYGRPGIAKFKDEAKKKGICVEFVEYVSKNMNDNETISVAERIQNYNATVFVLFISGGDLTQLSAKLRENGVRDKIWVASEAWATSRKVLGEGGSTMHGTLGIATRGGAMNGFRKFLESVSPFTQSSSPFIKDFWENSFHCSCPSHICVAGEKSRGRRQIAKVTKPVPPCSGHEKLTDVMNPYLQWTDSELEKSYTTYLAVYTVANALQNITKCQDGSGLLKDGKCPDLATLEPWQLLTYLKNVKFQAPGLEEEFGFDADGDPNATYKLVSWVPIPNSTSEDKVDFIHVGNYSKRHAQRWSLNTGAIFWHDGNGSQIFETPLSICSFPCTPGYYRVKLASDCCHKCVECPRGEYNNEENANTCNRCNISDMSNENRTACIPKPEDYMRWDDAYGITFISCSSLGVVLTLFAAAVFIRNRNTPIVKATNVEVSLLLFISITCCFLTPILYIGKPEDWSCRARQVSFILSFTLCVAAILVKTLRVLTAFQTTMPLTGRKRSKWLGEHLQILVVFMVALVQVALCVTWLIADPPSVSVNHNPYDRILIVCDHGSTALMVCVMVYLALLALVAFVLAFRARKLPENFNEAKFITFSMLVFFIVWISFIPAYLSTTGVMATAVYCIGILTSTLGFLGCIFFPKVYIILFTPERNTSERVRMNNVTHTFRQASRSVVYQINMERAATVAGTNSTSVGSAASNNNKSKVQFTDSPCASRAFKYNKNIRRVRRSGQAENNGGRKAGSEYSIEINGKLESSVTSPSKKQKSGRLESSFGVTLQVNIGTDQNSSEDNSSIESPRSTDNMLAEVDEDQEKPEAAEDCDVTDASFRKDKGKKKVYQSVPVKENYSENTYSFQTIGLKKRTMSKSKSYNGYSSNSSNAIEIFHDVTNEQKLEAEPRKCKLAWSSSL